MNDSSLGGQPKGFDNKWDLGSKHEPTNTFNRLQASQVVLEALKSRRRTETPEWLSSLGKEIPDINNSPVSVSNTVSPALKNPVANTTTEYTPQKTMIEQAIKWLDKMFVQFELYASNFNLNVQGTNLVVSCTRPIKRTNDTGGLYSETDDNCLNYAGHIATQFWALVVRGCATKVEVFIIPTELLIAFSVSSVDDSGHEPLLVIESALRANEIIWHMQENVITSDQIPSLAKELFGDLIKVASGQLTESEVIANPLPTSTASGQNHPVVNSVASAIKSTLNSIDTKPTSTPNVIPDLEEQKPKSPLVSVQTIKAMQELLGMSDKEINNLIEIGKQALQSDDTATFEKVKIYSVTLETLKHSLSKALADLSLSNTN